MDSVVNWFMLLIVLICDPLALALFWSYFSLIKASNPTPTEPEEKPTEANIEPLVEENPTVPKKRRGRPKKVKTQIEELIKEIKEKEKVETKKKKTSHSI
jgi:hypothetical protein